MPEQNGPDESNQTPIDALRTTVENLRQFAEATIERGDHDQLVDITGSLANLQGVGALAAVAKAQLDATKSLAGSSKRLEFLTWGLIFLTVSLLVTAIVLIIQKSN